MPASFDQDVNVRLEIGFASDPRDGLGATTWTDVTTDLMAHEVSRASRQYELDRFEGGTAQFVLDNRSGDYDPNNATGPHFGDVLPFKRVRFSATHNAVTHVLWTGYVFSFEQEWQTKHGGGKGMATTTLRCGDEFRRMNLFTLLDSPWAFEVAAGLITAQQAFPTKNFAWYRLDEPQEELVCKAQLVPATYDLIPVGSEDFHGTYRNDPPTTGGLVFKSDNGARQFDTEFARNALVPQIVQNDYPFTVEAMVRIPPDQGTGFYWIYNGFDVDTLGVHVIRFGCFVSDIGEVVAFISDGTNSRRVPSAIRIDDDEPHHVVWRFSNASTFTVWVDGHDVTDTLAITTGGTGTPAFATWTALIDEWLIGGPPGQTSGHQAAWAVDELIVHDQTALNAIAIARHAQLALEGPEGAWGGETTGGRLEEVLTEVGVGMALPLADVDIDAGNTILGPHSLGVSVLEYAQRLAETEFGGLYVAADGVVRFRERHALFTELVHTDVQNTFGDVMGELGYVDILAPFDETQIRNKVSVKREDGPEQTAISGLSQIAFGVHEHSVTGLHSTDAHGADYAAFLVIQFKDPQQRIEKLEIRPQADPTNLWSAILALDLEDRERVRRRTPAGNTIEIDALVQGITHRGIASERLWVTEIHLSRVGIVGDDFWLLGIVGRGELGTNTVLGF